MNTVASTRYPRGMSTSSKLNAQEPPQTRHKSRMAVIQIHMAILKCDYERGPIEICERLISSAAEEAVEEMMTLSAMKPMMKTKHTATPTKTTGGLRRLPNPSTERRCPVGLSTSLGGRC